MSSAKIGVAPGRPCAWSAAHWLTSRPKRSDQARIAQPEPPARAFDGKVESMMVDSQAGANQIQHRHWDKGASHEWGSHIPTICANVSLRQSMPVIPVRKLLSCSTWL